MMQQSSCIIQNPKGGSTARSDQIRAKMMRLANPGWEGSGFMGETVQTTFFDEFW
jgi:hypothetical protein